MDANFLSSLFNVITALLTTGAAAYAILRRLRRTERASNEAAANATAAAQSAENARTITVEAVQQAHQSTFDAVEGSRQRTEKAVEGSRQATVYSAEQTTQALTFLAEQMADMWLEVQKRIDQHAHRNDEILRELVTALEARETGRRQKETWE